ncbi:ABC transporter substrate-binding protein [Bacillus dakarensis]|uniref:ABC transporter substrate-binding protein n=1 Tax=Robertmurraya dakarensis TaxID=1926278 RepID=UPI0009819C09|nr:ABC transporter substrate-binding protein [Bacillus dakarensis]
MGKRKLSLLAGLMAFVLLVFTGCSGSSETGGKGGSGDGGDTIKIGIAVATSGAIAKTGQDSLAAQRVAVEEINESGGVKIGDKSYKFELVHYDTEGKAESATAATERLIQQDKVMAVIGASTSTETAAMIPIAERNKTPMLTAVAAAPVLTNMGANYFTSASSQTIMAIQKYVDGMKNFDYKKVAMLHFNDEFGMATAEAVNKAFAENDIEIVFQEAFAPTQHEFGTMLDKVAATDAEVIFAVAQIESFVNLLKQAKEKGIKIPVRDGAGGALEEMIKILPPEYTHGLVGGSRSGRVDAEDHKAFRAKFEEPELVNSFHYSGRDSIYLLKDAFERAGSATDKEKLQEAIRASNFDGLMGNYQFNEKGENSIKSITGIVLDGEIHYYEKDEDIPQDVIDSIR